MSIQELLDQGYQIVIPCCEKCQETDVSTWKILFKDGSMTVVEAGDYSYTFKRRGEKVAEIPAENVLYIIRLEEE